MNVFEVSAKTGKNIIDAFQELFEIILTKNNLI